MKNNGKFKQITWIYLLVSLLLASLPFLVKGMSFCMLFAFVPLLFVEDMWHNQRVKGFWHVYYLYFLVWNIITTFWIWNATIPGVIGAVLVNALQMSIVFYLFRIFKRKHNKGSLMFLPYLFLIITWISWEYFYFNSEISWPWLTLGNAFANNTHAIQWYEYTGTLGGSLWIWLSNILLFFLIKRFRQIAIKQYLYLSLLTLIIIIGPIITSLIIYYNYQEKSNPKEILVLQPNIDPYHDKFEGMTRVAQDTLLLNLAEEKITDSTTLMVCPETFTSYINQKYVNRFSTVIRFKKFISNHPNVNIIFGAITTQFYPWNSYPGSFKDHKPTLTARSGQGFWYDAYNSSIILDSTDRYDIYHKSKLVVLAEYVPYPKILLKFKKLSIKLGGTISSYGTQPEVSIFTTSDSVKVGTAICYESVYGEYFSEYVKKGAQLMCVITNDGWWGNTPGLRQHLSYSKLRAIENRRCIARSANTGISALIDQRGDMIAHTDWWEPDALIGKLNLNDELTVYTKYGDYIGRGAEFAFVLLFMYFITSLFIKKEKS
ncbi:MAG: apolipoprotein N-acyltransferase [Bacteroidales bacterium]